VEVVRRVAEASFWPEKAFDHSGFKATHTKIGDLF